MNIHKSKHTSAAVLALALAAGASPALAAGHGGGMVGNRGGMARPSSGGSPSFSAPAARPMPASRPTNFNPGNFTRPANPGGAGNYRPNPGGNFTRPANPGGGNVRPNPGGTFHPGNRPTPLPETNLGNRPPFGGIPGGSRPPAPGDRPGSLVGQRPNVGINRPQIGDNLGVVNRPNYGTNIVNRPNFGNNTTNIVNRPQVGGNTVINRPTNITNITSNNITNVNPNIYRPSYGGYRPGYGWGGGYRPGYGWGGGYWPGYGWAGGYRPNPYWAYHQGWVNGFWNGNYSSGWGWNNWGNSALGWGVGIGMAAWGLGSLLNSWGYSSYVNPYYAPRTLVVQQPAVVVQQPYFDYSRPIDVTSPTPPQALIDQAVASFGSAREAFRAGDYPQALRLADQALQQTPNDPMLHEFRALCLFAMERYDEAAVPLYTVLSVGPGWDWTTLVGLYPDVNVYTQQLRALEAYCSATPRAAAARFVLASLYMTQGSTAAAAAALKDVVTLQPQDRLAAQLLTALTTKPPADASQAIADQSPPPHAAPAVSDQPPANPTPAQPPPLPTGPVPARLVGSWTASPVKDVAITLALNDDKSFTWKVNDRGQSREFRGNATFDNETLALAPPDQPPMVGKVTWNGDDRFQFKALGAPPEDPGLTFGK